MDSEDLCSVTQRQESERCDVSPLLLRCLCLTKCSEEASHLSAEVACTNPALSSLSTQPHLHTHVNPVSALPQ